MVPGGRSSNAWVCSQKRNGPFTCLSTNRRPGFHSTISVRQRTGSRCVVSTYSIVVPCRIGIGRGVRIRKPSHGGVSASRLYASAKNANESSTGNATS